jgi:hypothetical protein
MKLLLLSSVLVAMCLASCSEEPCATFPRQFTTVEFNLQDSSFISLPSDVEKIYDYKVRKCGFLVNKRIAEGGLLHRRVVRASGHVMLRYTPAFVTDTTYYFQLGPRGEIVAAYDSQH